MVCPVCHKDAPIVYRGIQAYCTACGNLRSVIGGPSVNLAGRPSKVGGLFAKAAGWTVLVVGLALAALTVAFFQWIFPEGAAGWYLGTPLGLIAAGIGGSLLYGARSLEKTGSNQERRIHEKAVWAFAQNRRGVVSAAEVARSVGITDEQADTLLTDLAKSQPEQVTVDVDDEGNISYRFLAFAPPDVGFRVGTPRVRVGGAPAPVAGSIEEAALLEAEQASQGEAKVHRR